MVSRPLLKAEALLSRKTPPLTVVAPAPLLAPLRINMPVLSFTSEPSLLMVPLSTWSAVLLYLEHGAAADRNVARVRAASQLAGAADL